MPLAAKNIVVIATCMLVISFLCLKLAYANPLNVKLFFGSSPTLQAITKSPSIENTYLTRLTDYEGKPIPNAQVVWGASNDQAATIAAPLTTTDENGYSTAIIEIQPESTVILTASYKKITQTLEVITEKKFRHSRELTIENDRAEANGVDAITVTAHIIGPINAEPASGGVINWHIREDDNSAKALLIETQTESNSEGKASINVRAVESGTAVIVATLKNPSSVSDDAQKTKRIEFVKNTTLGLQPLVIGSQYPESTTASAINVTATTQADANQPNLQRKIYWQLHNPLTPGVSLIPQPSGNRPGTHMAKVISAHPGRVGVVITAYNPDNPDVVERHRTFVNFQRTYHLEPLILQNDGAEANGADEVIVKTTLVNQNQIGRGGGIIRWSLEENSANAYLMANTVETNRLGLAEARLKSNQAGFVTIKATVSDNGVAPPITQSRRVTFVKSYNVGLTNLAVDKSIATGNGEDAITITATVVKRDGLGPKANQTVHWQADTGTMSSNDVILGGTTSTTDSKGEATTTIRAKVSGSITVTATVRDANNPERAEHLRINTYFQNQAGISSISADPASAKIRSGYITVIANVVDSKNNPLSGQPVVWSLANIGDTRAHFLGLTEGNMNLSNPQGKAIARLRAMKAGTVDVVATIAAQPKNDSFPIEKTQSTKVYFDESLGAMNLTANVIGAVEANNNENITLTAQLTSTTHPEDTVRRKIQWRVKNHDNNDTQLVTGSKDHTSYTNTEGKTSIKLKATKAGRTTVTAIIASTDNNGREGEVKQELPILFKRTVKDVTLKISQTRPLFNDKTTLTITAIADDGKPLAGANVAWNTTSQRGSQSNRMDTTDTKGKASVDYTSSDPSAVEVAITVQSINSGEEKTIYTGVIEFQNFIVYELTPLTNNPVIPTGENGIVYTALLKTVSQSNKSTRLVSGRKVSLSWQDNAEEKRPRVTFLSSASNDEGKIQFRVSSENEFSNKMTVLPEGVSLRPSVAGQARNLTFRHTVKIDKLELKTDRNTVQLGHKRLADGQETVRVIAKAISESNTGIPGIPIAWSSEGAGYRKTYSGLITDEHGEAWAEYHSKGQAGILKITATAGISGSDNTQTQTAPDINFTHFKVLFSGAPTTTDQNKLTLTASVVDVPVDSAEYSSSPRYLNNKRIKVSWVGGTNNPTVNFPNGDRSDINGKVIIELTKSAKGNFKLKAEAEGMGALKVTDEEAISIVFK